MTVDISVINGTIRNESSGMRVSTPKKTFDTSKSKGDTTKRSSSTRRLDLSSRVAAAPTNRGLDETRAAQPVLKETDVMRRKMMMLNMKKLTTDKLLEQAPKLVAADAARRNVENSARQDRINRLRTQLREKKRILAELEMQKTGEISRMKTAEMSSLAKIAKEKDDYESNAGILSAVLTNHQKVVKLERCAIDIPEVHSICEETAKILTKHQALISTPYSELVEYGKEQQKLKITLDDLTTSRTKCQELTTAIDLAMKKRVAMEFLNTVENADLDDFTEFRDAMLD